MAKTDVNVDELAQRLGRLDVFDPAPLSGGASSLSFVGRAGTSDGERVVIKVAPPGVPPTLNRDVLRQARLIGALAATAVPVPRVIAQDAGDPPEVPPLFVMSFVEGASLEPLFDHGGREAPDVVAERMRSAARTLAALHAVDPGSVGLADEPRVTPNDEIERWCRLLETVDPSLVPGWGDVAARLRATIPPELEPAIVHGDFRLGNVLANGSAIDAVVDWEIWSVGDPRIDLGWFLVNADPETYRRDTGYAAAVPSPAELLEVYADAAGRAVPDHQWFEALACFKSTATWALIVKHNRRRSVPDPEHEAMAEALPRLLSRAAALLA